MYHRPSNKPQYFFLVSMKNGCMGIIFNEFIFRIVGNFFPVNTSSGQLWYALTYKRLFYRTKTITPFKSICIRPFPQFYTILLQISIIPYTIIRLCSIPRCSSFAVAVLVVAWLLSYCLHKTACKLSGPAY